MSRDEVYRLVDDERAYQDSMKKGPNGRTDGHTKQVGSFLSLMQHALNEAHRRYYEKQGDQEAMDFVRKLTAMGVQCMEIHGAPARVLPNGGNK